MWGIPYNATADAQVASLGYTSLPRQYYVGSADGFCYGLDKPSLPVDGVQVWPAEMDPVNDVPKLDTISNLTIDEDGDEARSTVTDQQSVTREAVSAAFALYEHDRQAFGTRANSRTSDNADDLYLKQDEIERVAVLFAKQDDE